MHSPDNPNTQNAKIDLAQVQATLTSMHNRAPV